MITCDAVSVSLYRNTGVSLSRHTVTHDFAGALTGSRPPVRLHRSLAAFMNVIVTSPKLTGSMLMDQMDLAV
jgi:hypothetical protein